MEQFSRNIGRLLLFWRWIIVAALAKEFLLAGASGHAPPLVSPLVAFGALAGWTVLATVLLLTWKSSERALLIGPLDTVVAALVILSENGTAPSVPAAMLLTLPTVTLYSLNPAFGVSGTFISGTVFTGLMVFRKDGIEALMGFAPPGGAAWVYILLVVCAIMGTLYHALLRQEAQARALVSVIETSQQLGSSASLEKILNLVTRDVKSLFGCGTCVIYLREGDHHHEPVIRVAQASTGIPEAFTDFNPELMQSVVGQVIKEKKGRILGDFLSYQPENTIRKEVIFRSTMVAPLVFEEEAIGAIFVSHNVPDVYGENIFHLFSMLATQVALAVRNVQLHKTTATLAVTDSLSGLFTHGYFQEHLGKEIIQAKYSRQPVSLMIIDVDFFKKVNDSYGHPQGDALLKQLGGIIKQVTRPTDVVCRYGGDEFTVTMLDTNRISAVVIAERIRQTVEDYEFVLGNQVVHVTVSGGVASFPEDAETKKDLIEKADKAMYEAKHKGRNRVCFSA